MSIYISKKPTLKRVKGPRPRVSPQFPVGSVLADSRGQKYVVYLDGSFRRIKEVDNPKEST